jgi:hypothetical protein
MSLCLVNDDNSALNLHELGYVEMGGYFIFQNGLPLVFHFVMNLFFLVSDLQQVWLIEHYTVTY